MNVVATSAATSAAVTAAAAQQRRMRKEEEEMTAYQPHDLDGWEFKILRGTTARFRDAHSLQAALTEEAQAGWELVEKFDNHRVRLKRRTEWRAKDAGLPFDPYRTYVGMSQAAMLGWVVAVLVGLTVLGAAIALAAR